VAQQILAAECPEESTLQRFAVFALAGDQPDHHVGGHLDLLAKEFELDAASLRAEFNRLRPVARGIFHDLKTETPLQAWTRALLATQATARRRMEFPVQTLLPVLRRYATFTGSTCGVERGFALQCRMLGPFRNYKSSLAVERTLALGSTQPNTEMDGEMVSAARLIWSQHFAAARGRRPPARPRVAKAARRRSSLAQKRRDRQESLRNAVGQGLAGNPRVVRITRSLAKRLRSARQGAEVKRQETPAAQRRRGKRSLPCSDVFVWCRTSWRGDPARTLPRRSWFGGPCPAIASEHPS